MAGEGSVMTASRGLAAARCRAGRADPSATTTPTGSAPDATGPLRIDWIRVSIASPGPPPAPTNGCAKDAGRGDATTGMSPNASAVADGSTSTTAWSAASVSDRRGCSPQASETTTRPSCGISCSLLGCCGRDAGSPQANCRECGTGRNLVPNGSAGSNWRRSTSPR